MQTNEMLKICLLTLFVYFLDSATSQEKTLFSYSDIYDSKFRPKSFNPIWIQGSDDFLYRNSSTGALMRFETALEKSTVFVDETVFKTYGSTYSVSPDLKYILFARDVQMRYRRSYRAKYTIYNIAQPNDLVFLQRNASLEYAGWAPTGNALSFVDESNALHYQPSPTGSSKPLTSPGNETLFHGIPDWLYEEDVIESRVSHYWSPDGKYICYASISNWGVPLQDVPFYGPANDVYGKTFQIPYPKAGDIHNGAVGTNPTVTMHVADVTSSTSKDLAKPAEFSGDYYFISVYWNNNSHVMVTWANRVQNHSLSYIYDATAASPNNGIRNLDYTMTNGWIEMSDTPRIFIDGGARYLMILGKGTSPDTYRVPHVVSSDLAANIVPLLDKTETDRILGYHEGERKVFFITTNGNSSERHIASIVIPASGPPTEPAKCLTCEVDDDGCNYYTASFNDDATYYVEGCLGPGVPKYTLKSTTNDNYNVLLEENADVKASVQTKYLPDKTYFNFKSADGSYDLTGQVFMPPNPQDGEKFKMLVYTYAGPGTQLVLETFPLGGTTGNWLTYLGSTHRIAVVSVDGRGTAGSGDKKKFEMYKNMGTVEIQDQIAGGKAAFEKFSNLDSGANAAIFGWSYGGFTTAHAVADAGDFYKCGISVAPVTDQSFYDTAYAERYLGLDLPLDGQWAYNASSILNKINGFKNKIYMIAHGMADDNVHYMNTAHLIRSLEDADILFDQITYPDEAHSISNPERNRHLYHSMSFFLNNNCWPKSAGSTASAIYFTGVIVIAILARILS